MDELKRLMPEMLLLCHWYCRLYEVCTIIYSTVHDCIIHCSIAIQWKLIRRVTLDPEILILLTGDLYNERDLEASVF